MKVAAPADMLQNPYIIPLLNPYFLSSRDAGTDTTR
jgi:hypothetical protein